MRSPDLNLLPIAFALYDELSVSRAARLLGMSQPAVSMALRRMREMFDDPLFIRVPTGITPTPRAHAIVRMARPLLGKLQEDLLKGETFDAASSTRTFTLALSDAGEMAFLPRIMEKLRSRAPHCTIRSVAVPTGQLAHELEKGEVDLAVGYFPALTLKNVRQRRVSTQHFACLIRADHPVRAERLSLADFSASEHIVVRAEGRSQEVFERFLERRRIKRNIAVVTPHFLSIPFMVTHRNLIATIPHSVVLHFTSMSPLLAAAMLPFDAPSFDLKLHWHRRFDNEARSRWLREQLAEVFKEDQIAPPPPLPLPHIKRSRPDGGRRRLDPVPPPVKP